MSNISSRFVSNKWWLRQESSINFTKSKQGAVAIMYTPRRTARRLQSSGVEATHHQPPLFARRGTMDHHWGVPSSAEHRQEGSGARNGHHWVICSHRSTDGRTVSQGPERVIRCFHQDVCGLPMTNGGEQGWTFDQLIEGWFGGWNPLWAW